jgi:hypothetical protein
MDMCIYVEESVFGHIFMISMVFIICYVAHWLMKKY